MNFQDWLFWNVDTQIDFVEPNGKLYVPGAEMLKPVWSNLTQLAEEKSITVVNTADYHFPDSRELSSSPNLTTTFPPHCMANTHGAEYIRETKPEKALVFNWDKKYASSPEMFNKKANRNIIIRKDAFDVFTGNPFTEDILSQISPKTVIVYGVTTNVCVNDAVLGLVKRVENVFVVEDAIKELPNIPLPFENWKNLGVELISFKDLKKLLNA